MLGFITLFFPAVLSVALVDHMRKIKLSVRGMIYCYATANLFINVACILIKMGLFQVAITSTALSANMTMQMSVDYLIFAIPMAIVFAFIAILLENKNILVKKSNNEENKEN